MQRPTVKEQDFVGKEAHLRHREEEPAAVLCTLTVDDHTSASGVKRYPLGREPITLRDGGAADRREGAPLVRHERGGGAVARQVHPAGVPAARARGRGLAGARGRVHERALPGDRRRRRRDAALRSRECEDPLVKVLVCVKRVPMTGGRIVLTDDAQAIETKHLGFTISPHEECGVEEAVRLVEAHGGESVVLTLGPAEAEEQLRDAMAIGIDRGIHLVDRRRGVGSRGDGRRDRRRDPRRRGGLGAVRPRSSSATSRPTRAASRSGSGSPTRSGGPCATGLKGVAVEGGGALRAGGRRRPRRLRAAAACRRDRARRAQPAALSRRSRRGCAQGASRSRSRAGAARRRGSSSPRLVVPGGRGASRPRSSATGPTRRPPSSSCSSDRGGVDEPRPRRARRRRRRRDLAAGAHAARRRSGGQVDALADRAGCRPRLPRVCRPPSPRCRARRARRLRARRLGGDRGRLVERLGAHAPSSRPGPRAATDAMARAAARLGEPLAANVVAVTPGDAACS